MKLSIKQVVLWFSLLLLTLAIAGIVGFKESYIKDKLIDLVNENTNRNFVISGDISVFIFPQPKLEATTITLNNKSNFSQEPLVSADGLSISVDWLPLLVDGKLVINNLALHGLKLSLITNKQGETNWQSSTQKSANNPSKQTQNKAALDGLITHFSLENAQVHWQNQQTDTQLTFQKLSARIENITINKPIRFAITTILDGNLTSNSGKLTWQGKGVIDKQLNHLTLNKSELFLSGFQQHQTVANPLATLTLAKAELGLNLEHFAVSSVKLKAGEFNLTANNLRIAPLTPWPSATATVSIPSFNPIQLATHLNLSMPANQANYALTEFSAAFTLLATRDSINASNVTAKLDKSQFSGNLRFNHNNPTHLAFDITGDHINWDDYTSPKPRLNQALPSATQPLTVNIPAPKTDLLKLNMDGTLKLQYVVINNVTLNDASLRLLSTQENLNIEHTNPTH
jgi:AsmA protein